MEETVSCPGSTGRFCSLSQWEDCPSLGESGKVTPNSRTCQHSTGRSLEPRATQDQQLLGRCYCKNGCPVLGQGCARSPHHLLPKRHGSGAGKEPRGDSLDHSKRHCRNSQGHGKLGGKSAKDSEYLSEEPGERIFPPQARFFPPCICFILCTWGERHS